MMFRFLHLLIALPALLFTHLAMAETAPKQTILFFGDSLSAAYGIPKEQGWVN